MTEPLGAGVLDVNKSGSLDVKKRNREYNPRSAFVFIEFYRSAISIGRQPIEYEVWQSERVVHIVLNHF